MTKSDIITLIEKRENDINKRIFKDRDKGLGCNQFRELADICLQTDIYEEVVLLIQYNMAKDKPVKKEYRSWRATNRTNGPSIGEVVIDCMKEIKDKSSPDDLMKKLSLFFGYMYWKARIWSSPNGNKLVQKQKGGSNNAIR